MSNAINATSHAELQRVHPPGAAQSTTTCGSVAAATARSASVSNLVNAIIQDASCFIAAMGTQYLELGLSKPLVARRTLQGDELLLTRRAPSVRAGSIVVDTPEKANLIAGVDRVSNMCTDKPNALLAVLRAVGSPAHGLSPPSLSLG